MAGRTIRSEPLPRDANGEIIRGGTKIPDVLNVTLNASTYTAVTLQDVENMGCKSIMANTRDDSTFLVSHLEAGTRYITVTTYLSLDIVADKGDTLFYVKASAGTPVLEVLLLD